MSSRRLLLNGVAGGLMMAACGLVLPAWSFEAEARDGALDGDKGGRRGKNRRGRGKRTSGSRDKHDKKQDDNPRGRNFLELRGIAIYVHNYRSVPVQVQGWQFLKINTTSNVHNDLYEVPSGWEWSTIPARSADGSHSARTFASKKREVAVQIGADRVVRGSNAPLGLPEAEIRTGGWELEGWTVGESLNLHDMLVWQSINADGIKITRIPDNDDYIQFSVDL